MLGRRLSAFFIREERGRSASDLRAAADRNEDGLRALVPDATVAKVPIFADDDMAPMGGRHVGRELQGLGWPQGVTDIVLDLSALSIGVGFPAALYLLGSCEKMEEVDFHLMISPDPALDDRIHGEPADQPMAIHGFAGDAGIDSELQVAGLWLPQLAHGHGPALAKIRGTLNDIYKVCPVLPFPASDPRRADDLIAEFRTQIADEWEVDLRDIIYVSERNPLDTYRTISTLKQRYDQAVEGIYEPRLILSPLGSKVVAVGSMMAAIRHNLTIQYVETLRYEADKLPSFNDPGASDSLVHVWLHGPIYAEYPL